MTSLLPPGAVAARIAAVSTHLPTTVLDNDALAALYPSWPAAKIEDKTGITERRIAAPDETATDLACAAVDRLLDSGACCREDIDFVILCTQAPDYFLPSSACVLQHRTGLSTAIGALDINLGCSGYVYGLSLASGLIASGAARTVLLVTADTYSKFIHPGDKSVRTLFGDGAAATLVVAAEPGDGGTIGPFVFGTDGAGAGDLIVEAGGLRVPRTADTARAVPDDAGNVRSREQLFMNGGAVLNFTLREVPRAVGALMQRTGTSAADYDAFFLHQANRFMLDTLQKKLKIEDGKMPRHFAHIGNTVSSSIPFVLEREIAEGRCSHGMRAMLVGFGVGLSWAAGSVTF